MAGRVSEVVLGREAGEVQDHEQQEQDAARDA